MPIIIRILWGLTFVAFAGALARLIWQTPTEQTMGEVQKIFYIHLPVAISAFLACFVMFIAGVGYLWQRNLWWDDLAAAAGKVAALYCTIVLVTGMIWGKSAWGLWWTWSPRLTFSLVLWLLYVVALMIRTSIESPQRRALVFSVYAVIAFLDVPVVYLSTKLMPNDIHPASIELSPAMKTTLMVWFIPVGLMMITAIWTQYRLHVAGRLIRESVNESIVADSSAAMA